MTANDLESRVQRLEDREEIRELIEVLFYLVDNGHGGEVPERCFAVDGVYEYPPIEIRGRDEIRRFVLKDGEYHDVVHNITQFHTEIDGDTAHAVARIEWFSTLASPKETPNSDSERIPTNHLFLQHQYDLRRDPEGWRIVRVRSRFSTSPRNEPLPWPVWRPTGSSPTELSGS